MPRYAVINAALVTNIVTWDGISQYNPGGTLVATNTGQIGDSYSAGTFTPNVPAVPRINLITKAAAVSALANRLGADVGALLAVVAGTSASADIPKIPGDPATGT
jgi:hypothetical protein